MTIHGRVKTFIFKSKSQTSRSQPNVTSAAKTLSVRNGYVSRLQIWCGPRD